MRIHPPEAPNIMQQKFLNSSRTGEVHHPRALPARANMYFFYGALKTPERLLEVTSIYQKPEFKEAKVHRRSLKYWGNSPVLCRGSDTVTGVVWLATDSIVVERLRTFAGDFYRDAPVQVELDDGSTQLVMTFVWDRNEDDLTDQPTNCIESLPGRVEVAPRQMTPEIST